MNVQVDLSKATIGDLRLLDGVARGKTPLGEMVDFLDRVVIGGAAQLPMTEYRAVMEAVMSAISGGETEKNS